MSGARGRRVRVGSAVGVAVLAGVLFTMPLDGWPDPRTLLPWGLSLEVTAHLVIAAGVAFTWGVAFPEVGPLRLLLWALLFAFAAEALQLLPLAAERNVRLDDALTNVLGVGVGWGLAMGARWWRSRAGRGARRG